MSFKIANSLLKTSRYASFNRRFATYKTSTGLVGLAVQPDGKNVLLNVAGEAINKLKVI